MNAAAILNADPDTAAKVDYIIPATGQTSMGGNWARRLLETDLDIGAMRPYVDKWNRSFITRQTLVENAKTGRMEARNVKVQTWNDSQATLRFLDWIEIDNQVREAAKPRLQVVGDFRGAGMVYNLPNGIAKTVMQYQTVSDITGATMSMDALRVSESDRPVFATVNFPLPLIHKDFQYPMRQLLASRTGQSPLDLVTARRASRRVAEQVEQLTLGVANNRDLDGRATYSWDNLAVYGLTNFPGRLTYSMTLPTAGGWTPQTTTNDLIAMRTLLRANGHFGPYMVYVGTGWDNYLDRDYAGFYAESLRTRLTTLEQVQDVRTVDYLPGYTMLMLQMDPEVIRMVIGLDIVTVQWESHGGFQLNFKVMCLILPQIRGDFYNNIGIIQAS